jgi:hypothetical protein
MMKKYGYKTEIDSEGNVKRFRIWNETFTDLDTGKDITIKRHRMIKFNGDPVRWYNTKELRQMTAKQRHAINLKIKAQ